MREYAELNIKDGMPLVREAMDYLRASLLRLKKDKCRCVLIIHGYGSTGKGGAIGESARQLLRAQERSGVLKSVIFGEDFTIFNPKAREIKDRYRELEPLLRICNHGVTVAEL